MSTFGLVGLLLAFAGCLVSVLGIATGHVIGAKDAKAGKSAPEGDFTTAQMLSWAGRLAAVLSAAGLTVCVGVLAVCFLTGDYSIQYVLDNHSSNTGAFAWFYQLSGIWAGQEGSLLLWAWIISVINAIMALRGLGKLDALDNVAVGFAQLVLLAFVCVMLFDENNMPFIVTESQYYDTDGSLTVAAGLLGMNTLLEHWAMAVHPPTLFLGYAAMTVPFAYALSALVVNDASRAWVDRSTRFLLVGWLFLSIGIGLGAVWAYTVLGWGGYWGWDPVENASLLPWLMGVALIHSFTAYRQRGAFKRWAVLCACLTFTFVIVGTFISRSGLVQSVHAFAGDQVSLVVFLTLIIASVVLGIAGLAWRWKSFEADAEDELESMFSKDGMYYLNNVIMLVLSCLLTYMTLTSALPDFLPFGGQSLSAGSYNAIARPLGIVYLLMVALGPLTAWGKTNKKAFLRQIKVPALCAVVLFALLMVLYVTQLYPVYQAAVDAGGSTAESFLEQGPSWYYNALAVIGLAVASLLVMNALFFAVRSLKGRAQSKRLRPSSFGGALSHLGLGIVLVGLIGSSMYVTETSGYVAWDEETDQASETYVVKDYELVFDHSTITSQDNGDVVYEVTFDVYRNGSYVGTVSPSVKKVANTQQLQLNASVLDAPLEDLFVIYQGASANSDSLSMKVLVNPLVKFVWIGFAILCLGVCCSLAGRIRPLPQKRQDACR